MQETLLKIRYFERGLSKKPFKKLHPVPFYGQDYEKEKGYGNSYESLLRSKICSEKSLFSNLSTGQFWWFRSGFWVILKITFANLSKPIYDVIIIPVSSDPLNMETVERKGIKYKKLNISRTKRAI